MRVKIKEEPKTYQFMAFSSQTFNVNGELYTLPIVIVRDAATKKVQIYKVDDIEGMEN